MANGERTTAEFRQRALWILGLATIARGLVLLNILTTYPRNWFFTRGVEMSLLANSMLHGKGFSSPFGGDTGPTAFIAPGYPILVAGIFSILGSYSSASAVAIMALQLVVNVATIWVMMQVARTMLDERAAYVAGAFWALCPPLPWMPTILWETSLSAFALTGMLALALKTRTAQGRLIWLLMGGLSGLAALINPALLPALCLMLAWAAWQKRSAAPDALAIGLVALLLVYGAWPIRNAYTFHAFIPLRSTVGLEMWMGNRPGATGYLDESIVPYFNKQEFADYVSQGELAYTGAKSAMAKNYILEHPATFLKLSARRIFRFWSGTGTKPEPLLYAIEASLTSILGGIGLWFLARRGDAARAWLFALPLLAFPIPYYITHAEFRYRLVIDPLMTILAGCAVSQLSRNSRAEGLMVSGTADISPGDSALEVLSGYPSTS